VPDIPLFFRVIDYVSDLGTAVRVWQPYVHVQFVTRNGTLVPRQCLVDSGAPLSVIPSSLWHGRDVLVTALGTQLALTQTGTAAPEALLWMGAPCDLGETAIFLLDPDSAIRTGPHRMIAKLVRLPFTGRQKSLERMMLLGEGFLADNDIGLVKQSTVGILTGHLSVP
jgi:hypothetical protein